MTEDLDSILMFRPWLRGNWDRYVRSPDANGLGEPGLLFLIPDGLLDDESDHGGLKVGEMLYGTDALLSMMYLSHREGLPPSAYSPFFRFDDVEYMYGSNQLLPLQPKDRDRMLTYIYESGHRSPEHESGPAVRSKAEKEG